LSFSFLKEKKKHLFFSAMSPTKKDKKLAKRVKTLGVVEKVDVKKQTKTKKSVVIPPPPEEKPIPKPKADQKKKAPKKTTPDVTMRSVSQLKPRTRTQVAGTKGPEEPVQKMIKVEKKPKIRRVKPEAFLPTGDKFRRGIIRLNHIPHGFFEEEMRKYFSQFGKVLRLRLARSKKTGKSKGYAFVEFEFEDVAKIVAEAMDGYLMYERLIKCELMPPVSVVDAKRIFAYHFVREDNYPKLQARHRVKVEECRKKTDEEVRTFLQFRLKKLKEQNDKLAALGIDYKYSPPRINTSS